MARRSVLWIENEWSDFEIVHDELVRQGYAVVPRRDEYAQFFQKIIAIARGTDSPAVAESISALDRRLVEEDVRVVILDVSLLTSMEDEDGIRRVLPVIRRIAGLVPVVLLTRHPFEKIAHAFSAHDAMANYYLHKVQFGDVALDRNFVQRVMIPVVAMLDHWYAIARYEGDIRDCVKESVGEVLRVVTDGMDVVIQKLDEIEDDVGATERLSRVTLAVLRAQAQRDDSYAEKVAANLVDELLGNEDFPELRASRQTLSELVGQLRGEFAKAVRGEISDDLIDYLRRTLAATCGMKNDARLSEIAVKVIWRASKRAWRFYRSGN